MKKLIKLISILLLISTPLLGQIATRNPSNVRYIGGGYINKTPFFNNLRSALNSVKTSATSSNPYVFWVMSDTTQIYDWDSTYVGASMSIKDSIDTYYVSLGKIKWAGFGIASTSVVILPPDSGTIHYTLPIHSPIIPIYSWQDSLNIAMKILDDIIYSLITYTNGVLLHIEDDTLKIRMEVLIDSLRSLGTWVKQTPDTIKYDPSQFVRTDADSETDTTVITKIEGWLRMGIKSKLSIPMKTSKSDSTVRGLSGDSAGVYYNPLGTPTSNRALMFQDEADSLVSGKESFTTTAQTDTVSAIGIQANDIVIVTAIDSVLTANDMLSVKIITNKFVVQRLAGGVSGLSYNYIWKKD